MKHTHAYLHNLSEFYNSTFTCSKNNAYLVFPAFLFPLSIYTCNRYLDCSFTFKRSLVIKGDFGNFHSRLRSIHKLTSLFDTIIIAYCNVIVLFCLLIRPPLEDISAVINVVVTIVCIANIGTYSTAHILCTCMHVSEID